MSILRQLLLSITLAIMVILLGALALNVNAAREYLSDQLQVQSNDGAISLALSLSQPANNDPVVQELLVSALFDGGHYALVRLQDTDGTVLVARQAKAVDDGVPHWFKSLAKMRTSPATHAVSDGWKQLGTVTLQASETDAWRSLWQGSVRMAGLVLVAGGLWALFAFALVRWIKNRLLREISEQVLEIGREGSARPVHARVPELRGVAEALNQTRERILATTEEHNARIESLELQMNLDPVTGLANRKYFLNEMRRVMETPAPAAAGGHVLIFRQRDLAGLNRHLPRDFVDQWLRGVCERLQATLQRAQATSAMVGRLNGSDFAVLLPQVAAPQALVVADALRLDLRASRIPVGEGHLCRWAMSLADYAAPAQASAVLGRLDFGLMRAESSGDDHVVVVDESDRQGPSEAGKLAWHATISSALAEDRYGLETVPLLTARGEPVRTEATLMLKDAQGRPPLHATQFIPAAVRLGLVAECDLRAVKLGLDWLADNDDELAVRIALPSLLDGRFLGRLGELLQPRPGQARRLFLAVDAHGLAEHPQEVAALGRVATQAGAHLGLRRLAQQFTAVSQLHAVPLAYVKLGGGFVGGMSQSPGSQQLTAWVVDTARGLGIEVYAEDVPDAKTRRILSGLDINVMRGPGVTPLPPDGEGDD